MEQTENTQQKEGRIVVAGSLLQRAVKNDPEAVKTIFKQFIPSEESIFHAEYYGYFGFWFIGRHSFSCLTDKRLSSLRVGPFKRVVYEDGFYENMTSGGIYQPSKFWLRIFMIIGLLAGFILFMAGIGYLLSFFLVDLLGFYGLLDNEFLLPGTSALLALLLMPFLGNAITMFFYRLNPCGLACWVREKQPVIVLVNRNMMTKANRLYRMWSNLREDRNKYIKTKYK